MRRLEPGYLELAVHVGVTQRDGSGGGDVDVPPQAHVEIRWLRVVVVPTRGSLDLFRAVILVRNVPRRGHLDGKAVPAAHNDVLVHLELEPAEHAHHVLLVGNLLPVEPYVRAEIEAVEVQDQVPAFQFARHVKLLTEPPRRVERAVLGHDQPQALPISGDLLEVIPVIRVRINAIFDQCR